MNDMEFETRLQVIASGMEYPRTPDIAGSVMARLNPSPQPRFTRRFAWSLAIVFVLVSSLMFVPPVRAAIIEFIQIGIVRIFPQPVEETPGIGAPVTATPLPSLFPLLDNIAGETTLAYARQTAPYPILLPPDLDEPDHIYVQDTEGVMTILVWMDTQRPELVAMSLHFVPADSWAIKKTSPLVVREVDINGQRAVWTEGPYPLILSNDKIELSRMVDGHVLIWTDGDITYRLETYLSLEEAIRIAESLEPIQ